MNHKRLKILEAALRRPLPPQTKFNMGHWRKEVSCDTICCALGLAAVTPGLKRCFELNAVHMPNSTDYIISVPKKAFCSGFDAAKEVFGLIETEVHFIFSGNTYPKHPSHVTPTDVADRIASLLPQKGNN